jgi:hypothetical protein
VKQFEEQEEARKQERMREEDRTATILTRTKIINKE